MTRHPTRMFAVTARIDASLHDRARSRALIVGFRRRQQHKMQPVVRRAHLHHRRCVPGERPACCSSTASLGSSASNVACRSAVSARRDGKSQRSRSAEGTLHPSPATTRGVARGASWSPSPPHNPAAPEPEGSWHLSGHLDRTHSPAGERAEEKGVLTCSANVSMTAYGVV